MIELTSVIAVTHDKVVFHRDLLFQFGNLCLQQLFCPVIRIYDLAMPFARRGSLSYNAIDAALEKGVTASRQYSGNMLENKVCFVTMDSFLSSRSNFPTF